MNYRNMLAISVSILMVLFAVACATNEAKQTEPVSTTAGGVTSIASPAVEAHKQDMAFLRIVHAVPGGGAVDILTDRDLSFTDSIYKQVTPYKEIESEIQNIRVIPAGQTNAQQPLTTNREILAAGHHYTAVVVPAINGNGITLRVVDDNITPPAAGKAKIRVLHAAADAGEVDVFAKGTNPALFGGVDYPSATSYYSVDPMSTALEVRPKGEANPILTIPNAKFEAGKIYTIVVTGSVKAIPKLEATIIQDELVNAMRKNEVVPSAFPTTSTTTLPRT